MRKTAVRLLLTAFFAFMCFYLIIAICLPSSVSIVEGEKAKISSVVPVSISSNSETEGVIEYDFSSMEVSSETPGSYDATVSVMGIPVKSVSINVMEDKMLIPVGNVEGIVLKYDGMLVLGTGKIETDSGETVSPSKGILKSGDMIQSVNGQKVETHEELNEIIAENGDNELEIVLKRNDEIKTVEVMPVFSSADNSYKIGCWIRSDTQGLGTITFIDKENMTFGALGHGVYDSDTGTLMEIKDGTVTKSFISGINKSQKGTPGEITGALDKSKTYGEIEKNTSCGIYGSIYDISDFDDIESMPIASSSQVKEGKAYIISDALDGKRQEYEITIEKILGFGSSDDKSMVIRIDDERLLNITGGIVQGMSGSPIIQDGKIIGAVTHVFVNDPQRGYGIFVENMLEMNG